MEDVFVRNNRPYIESQITQKTLTHCSLLLLLLLIMHLHQLIYSLCVSVGFYATAHAADLNIVVTGSFFLVHIFWFVCMLYDHMQST
jgi:uncharacterized membrane protein YphA (DoxX/SURF4 family)